METMISYDAFPARLAETLHRIRSRLRDDSFFESPRTTLMDMEFALESSPRFRVLQVARTPRSGTCTETSSSRIPTATKDFNSVRFWIRTTP